MNNSTPEALINLKAIWLLNSYPCLYTTDEETSKCRPTVPLKFELLFRASQILAWHSACPTLSSPGEGGGQPFKGTVKQYPWGQATHHLICLPLRIEAWVQNSFSSKDSQKNAKIFQ